MAKSFRFPRWVEKTRTYSIHPVAFIDQPVATPHQPRYAQQLPPGEAKGQLQELVPFNVLLCSVRKWRLRRTGSPTW